MSDANVTVLPDFLTDCETVVCDGEVTWLPKPPACERNPEHIRRDAEMAILVTSPPTDARH